MKRVFCFKKNVETDWNEPMMAWLEKTLAEEPKIIFNMKNNYPRFKKNWKVIINIEEV